MRKNPSANLRAGLRSPSLFKNFVPITEISRGHGFGWQEFELGQIFESRSAFKTGDDGIHEVLLHDDFLSPAGMQCMQKIFSHAALSAIRGHGGEFHLIGMA